LTGGAASAGGDALSLVGAALAAGFETPAADSGVVDVASVLGPFEQPRSARMSGTAKNTFCMSFTV
jgi:hypothetical protein